MFERFTEEARRTLFLARFEATQIGGLAIETEHLLLGLIREGRGLTNVIFAHAQVSLDVLLQEARGHLGTREKVPTSVEMPFSAETKRVLHFAAEEADRLLHNYIGNEHLLLGLVREERCGAAVVLAKHGMTLHGVREQIVMRLASKEPSPLDTAAVFRRLEEVRRLVWQLGGTETSSAEADDLRMLIQVELDAVRDALNGQGAR